MITLIEELVFGLNSYDKVKIEDRYEKIHSILLLKPTQIHSQTSNLKISSIEEFDSLEQCLFKIQDQLRVKSSNLNAIIRKPNSLTKKKIEGIIRLLQIKREEILHYVFTYSNYLDYNNYKQNDYNQDVDETNSKKIFLKDTFKDTNTTTDNKSNFKTEPRNVAPMSPSLNNNNNQDSFSETMLSLTKSGKVAVVTNALHDALNLVESKIFLEKLYSTHLYSATLLYAPSLFKKNLNNSLFHIGIFSNNTFNNPLLQRTNYIEQDFQGVFEKITRYREKNIIFDTQFRESNDSEESNLNYEKKLDDIKVNSQRYISINNEVKNIKTHKYSEDSLEDLVLSQEDSDKFIRGINHTNGDSPVEVEDDDSIIVEKQDPFGVQEDEINSEQNNKLKTYFNEESTDSIDKQAQTYEYSYQVYEDDIILTKINEKGLTHSQLSVVFKNNVDFFHQQPNIVAHTVLFSKYFLSSLFEITNSDATMLVTSLFSKKIELVSRFKNDNIFSLGGKGSSEEELNLVQKTIQSRLLKELETQKNFQEFLNEESSKPEINNESLNKHNQESRNEPPSKKRAKYLLSSLRRLG